MQRQQLTKFKQKQITFPINPTTAYNKHLAYPINTLVQSYHNPSWIRLEDEIHFNTHEQYFKRFYRYAQFRNKIKLLGDYYRYHVEMPRIFVDGVSRIMEVNIEDKRQLQYAIVTRQMQNNQQEDDYMSINTQRQVQPHEKLIKDVELSYEDFQERPIKKQKIIISKNINKQKPKNIQQEYEYLQHSRIRIIGCQNNKVQKCISRVDSIKFKGNFVVFKPKIQQETKKQHRTQPKIQPKYKRPKQQNKKTKKCQIQKKQNIQKTKHNSNNNSVNTQPGVLSRSKSRAHLHVVNINNPKFKSNQNPDKSKNQRSNATSLQSSIAKSMSKKQILGSKKVLDNCISRKGSRKQLKHEEKNAYRTITLQPQVKNHEQQNSVNTKATMMSRKQSKGKIQKIQNPNNKKMFNRAIQIKKKK